jgi:methyltransferase FkbM-like protein
MTVTDHPEGGLTSEDQLKFLVPGWLYYRHKIGKEARKAEPELLMLGDMVRRGCVAIDVGANRGIYSYALSRHAARVEAFEPNPDIASFARAKLGKRVRVHDVALSDREGTAVFYVPRMSGHGQHLLGNLRNTHPWADLEQRGPHRHARQLRLHQRRLHQDRRGRLGIRGDRGRARHDHR